MSWVGVWLGLSVPTVEVAQQVAFIVIFPITFVSNAFVPLQQPADLAPAASPSGTRSARLTASLRTLWGNPNPFPGDSLASTQPILVTLAWFAVILAIFAPLGVRRYRLMNR